MNLEWQALVSAYQIDSKGYSRLQEKPKPALEDVHLASSTPYEIEHNKYNPKVSAFTVTRDWDATMEFERISFAQKSRVCASQADGGTG